jgi:hypothetical protein
LQLDSISNRSLSPPTASTRSTSSPRPISSTSPAPASARASPTGQGRPSSTTPKSPKLGSKQSAFVPATGGPRRTSAMGTASQMASTIKSPSPTSHSPILKSPLGSSQNIPSSNSASSSTLSLVSPLPKNTENSPPSPTYLQPQHCIETKHVEIGESNESLDGETPPDTLLRISETTFTEGVGTAMPTKLLPEQQTQQDTKLPAPSVPLTANSIPRRDSRSDVRTSLHTSTEIPYISALESRIRRESRIGMRQTASVEVQVTMNDEALLELEVSFAQYNIFRNVNAQLVCRTRMRPFRERSRSSKPK